MREPDFSNQFNNMLKQIDKNIIIHNGQQCYRIPVSTINKLSKLFFENNNLDENNNEDNSLNSDEWKDFNFFY